MTMKVIDLDSNLINISTKNYNIEVKVNDFFGALH